MISWFFGQFDGQSRRTPWQAIRPRSASSAVIVLGLTPVRDLDLDLGCGRAGVPDVAVGVSGPWWAVSFIVTNIPANHADLIGLEAWFRNRTSIEERFREGKHGAGLNHLPSADADVNSVWAWAGLLAGALSVMLQSL